MQTRLVSTVLVLALALVAGGARANPKPIDKKKAAGLALFDKAGERYAQGSFEHAASLLREAYALYPDPTMLYNLARALEGAGKPEEALDAYRRYLATSPAASDRKVVEARMATIGAQLEERERLRRRSVEDQRAAERAAEAARRAQLEEAEARKASEAAQEEVRTLRLRASQRQARTRTIVAWSLAGVGVLGIAAGGALGGLAQRARAQAADDMISLDAGRDLASAQRLALGANISFGVGGALTAIGVIWGVVELAHRRRVHGVEQASR